MNTWTLSSSAASLLGANPLFARLAFVSLEMVLLAVGVALLIGVLRIRAPRVRALLWLLVLAKPILGLTLGTPLPLVYLQAMQPAAAVASDSPDVFRPSVPTVAQPTAEKRAVVAEPVGEPILAGSAIPPTSQPPTVSSSNRPESFPLAAPRNPLPLGHWLVGLWFIGVVGLMGLTIRDQIQIRRIRRSATDPRDDLARRFRELAEALHLKRCPRLRLTDALQSPALVGFVRFDVLLPRRLTEGAEPRRLDWMLRHELMHRKLNDPVALFIRRMAEILFYFHPAVWWAGRKWEEAMELACDRALLRTDADARTYAEQLYRVLESQSPSRRPAPLGGGLFATRTQIGKRIAALLGDPLRSPARLPVSSLAGLALLAVISLPVGFGLARAQSARPPGDKPISSEVTSHPESPAIPKPESGPLPGREITDDFTFEKEISLYQQMPTADGKGNASLQWIRFARHGEYWFGERKSLNPIRVDLRVVLGLSNAKWRIALALLDKDDKTLEQAESIYEDHAFASTTRYLSEATVFMMLPMMDQPTTPTRYRLRLEQAPPDAPANAEFCQPWPSPNRTTPLAWGKEVNGLRATIEFIPEREAYALGEEIGVCFHIQNVGTRTISMSFPRMAQCRAVVLDARSKDIPTSRPEIIGPVGYLEMRLAPGGEAVLYNTGLRFGGRGMKAEESETFRGTNVGRDAGRYLVKYLNLPDSEESQNLETGFREVIVVPASTVAQPARGSDGEVRNTRETTEAVLPSTVRQTALAWGKTVNGLRAALEFVPEKASYALGEPIGTNFRVQNVSTQPVSLAYGQAGLFVPAVEDGNGKPQKIETFTPYGKPRPVHQVLAPGQEIVIPDNRLMFKTPSSGITRGSGSHVLCDGPGRYSVHYKLRFKTYSQMWGKAGDSPDAGRKGPQQEDWQGELETGVCEVIVEADTTDAQPARAPKETLRTATEPAKSIPTSAASKPLAWGKDVDGLRAALEFVPEKASYALGEYFEMRFRVQNVGTQTVSLADGLGLFTKTATVEDGNGKPQKVETFVPFGHPALVRQVLAPQQEMVIPGGHLMFKTPSLGITRGGGSHFLCDGPGRYSVHYSLRFKTNSQLLGTAGDSPDAGGNRTQQEDWQGELETGVREVAVVTATTETEPAPGPDTDVRPATLTARRRLTGAVPKTAENPLGLDDDVRWNLSETARAFRTVFYGLLSYYQQYKTLPAKLTDLTTPVHLFKGELPNDPFGTGPVRVILEPTDPVRLILEPTKAVVASVGPDGRWDGGKPIDPADPTLTGDLVYEVTMGDLQRFPGDLQRSPDLEKIFKPLLPSLADPAEAPGGRRPPSTPDPKRPNVIWGPKVNGLRAALELTPEKTSYALGEPIGIRYHVQNVSTRTIPLACKTIPQYPAIVVDDKGTTQQVKTTFYTVLTQLQFVRRVLAPGEETVMESFGLSFDMSPRDTPRRPESAKEPATERPICSTAICSGPGRYFVHYKLPFRTSAQLSAQASGKSGDSPDAGRDDPQEEDWQGELETGVREVIVAPAMAEGIHTSEPRTQPGTTAPSSMTTTP